MNSRTFYQRRVPGPPDSLFPHEPVGTGTTRAESLTSYFKRLCYLHRLSPSFVIQEYLDLGHRRPRSGAYKNARSVNGLDKRAERWCSRLSRVTHRDGFEFHTLLPLKRMNWRRHLLETTGQKWCPECFVEQYASTGPMFEPLVWSFQSLRVCPEHRIRLRTDCPVCGGSTKPLTAHSLPGVCPGCRTVLGSVQAETKQSSEEWDESKQCWEQYKARQMGNLVSDLPTLSVASKTVLTKTMKTIIDQQFQSGAQLARWVCVSKSTVHDWHHQKRLPSFENLLRILYLVRGDLVCFLSGRAPEVAAACSLQEGPWDELQTYRVQPKSRDEIRQQLEQYLDQRIPSIAFVLRAVSISQKTLDTFPELKSKLMESVTEYQARCKDVNRARVVHHMRLIMDELRSDNRPITRKTVQSRMPKPKYFLDPYIQEKFHERKDHLTDSDKQPPVRERAQPTRYDTKRENAHS